jgi:hypothetical protein
VTLYEDFGTNAGLQSDQRSSPPLSSGGEVGQNMKLTSRVYVFLALGTATFINTF